MKKFEALDPIEKETIDAYNLIAPLYERKQPEIFVDEHIMQFEKVFDEGSSLIDIGCGVGKAIPMLERLGMSKYVGIDASNAMIEIARGSYPHRFFHVIDFYSLPNLFLPSAFDSFFSQSALMHVTPARMPRALSAIHSILKQGGVGFLTLPSGEGSFKKSSYYEQKLDIGVTTYAWQEEEILKLLKESGFTSLETHTCGNCEIIASVVQKV